MKVNRRRFLQIGSLTALQAPWLMQGCGRLHRHETDAARTEEHLFSLFAEPPATARPFVRWWWNGNRITEAEVLRELDLLSGAGIGGVEINTIAFPRTADAVGYTALEWLSPEWIDLLKFTCDAAAGRGMICDVIVGSGWPFGGEFLEPPEQTQMATIGTRLLEGPGRVTLDPAGLLEEIDPPIHSKYSGVQKELIGLRLVPEDMPVFDPGAVLDLPSDRQPLTVDVPAGRHILYYVVKLTGYQAVILGAPGAAGPILNHYNRQAVERYLSRMSDALQARIGTPGDYLRAMFCDSLELEGANWNDDLPDEFMRRRGYDLRPWLPFVLTRVGHMGNPLEGGAAVRPGPEVELSLQRVRYDLYSTQMELFRERFLLPFAGWCRDNGVQSRIQAYGRGYHPLEASMEVDIPECETWVFREVGRVFPPDGYAGRAYTKINKFVASGARLAGKRLVSCEEITNTSMVFNATLQDIKITGDQSNLSGVTHSVLHGFNYSPPEAPFPGWIQFGTFFNERNPWWPFLRRWTDYKARISSVLQQIEPFADIAVLHPLADMWMKFGAQRDPFPTVDYPAYQHNVWEAIHQCGHGCDYISERILREASAEQAVLRYGSRAYDTLLLLDVETLEPETADALERFASAGGRIIFIGQPPHRSPGYRESEANDERVRSATERLLGLDAGRIARYDAPTGGSMIEWFLGLRQRFGLKPRLPIANPDPFVNQTGGKFGDLDVFFLANSHASAEFRLHIEAPSDGKTAWRWDAESGQRTPLSSRAGERLSLTLEPGGSMLLVFSPEPGAGPATVPSGDLQWETLQGEWRLSLRHADGSQVEMTLPALVDFRENPALRNFAGTATYRKTLQIGQPAEYARIDLGELYGVTELFINDRPLGTRWHGHHRYELDGALESGDNRLEIRITTTLGNYLKSLDNNPVAAEWSHHQDWQPNGLKGPVRLGKK
jgi:hypothetical protein